MAIAPAPSALYGLDIETDTARGGLDPRRAGVIAAALSPAALPSPAFSTAALSTADASSSDDASSACTDAPPVKVLLARNGDETRLLVELDTLMGDLEPGIIVTWNGARFDLPFLHYRAHRAGVEIGLRLFDRDGALIAPGSQARAAAACWHEHRHLDAIRVYRMLRGERPLSCSLKDVALRQGLQPVVETAGAVHLLDEDRLADYVASDARITRRLAEMAWPLASRYIDAPGPLILQS